MLTSEKSIESAFDVWISLLSFIENEKEQLGLKEYASLTQVFGDLLCNKVLPRSTLIHTNSFY